jgi:hypothetical protein
MRRLTGYDAKPLEPYLDAVSITYSRHDTTGVEFSTQVLNKSADVPGETYETVLLLFRYG